MALWVMQILCSSFLGVLFLQSGIDKITDREGNLAWLTGHFAESPLAGYVPILLSVVMLVEVVAGVLNAIGAGLILISGITTVAFFGAAASGIAVVMLFGGQRIAKDYEGAAVLTGYFLVTLVALQIMS